MIRHCHCCLGACELTANQIPICVQCRADLNNLPPRPRIEAVTRIIESVARERNTELLSELFIVLKSAVLLANEELLRQIDDEKDGEEWRNK